MQGWMCGSAAGGALEEDLGSRNPVGRNTGLYAVLCAELFHLGQFHLRCLLCAAASV